MNYFNNFRELLDKTEIQINNLADKETEQTQQIENLELELLDKVCCLTSNCLSECLSLAISYIPSLQW